MCPNVVYTCGALAHVDAFVVPYRHGGPSIAIAAGSVSAHIAGMRATDSTRQ